MRGLVVLIAALTAPVAGGALADDRYEIDVVTSVKNTNAVRSCLMTALSGRTQPIETPLVAGSVWQIAFLQERDKLTLKVEETPTRGTKITYPRRRGPDQAVYNKVRACA